MIRKPPVCLHMIFIDENLNLTLWVKLSPFSQKFLHLGQHHLHPSWLPVVSDVSKAFLKVTVYTSCRIATCFSREWVGQECSSWDWMRWKWTWIQIWRFELEIITWSRNSQVCLRISFDLLDTCWQMIGRKRGLRLDVNQYSNNGQLIKFLLMFSEHYSPKCVLYDEPQTDKTTCGHNLSIIGSNKNAKIVFGAFITLALFCIRLIRGGSKNSKNRSTCARNIQV